MMGEINLPRNNDMEILGPRGLWVMGIYFGMIHIFIQAWIYGDLYHLRSFHKSMDWIYGFLCKFM